MAKRMISINLMTKNAQHCLSVRRWREKHLQKALETAKIYRRRYKVSNPELCRRQNRDWERANPEKVLRDDRARAYGKGAHEHLLEQVAKQNNRCAICQKEFTKTPCLDHNHVTNCWRGALCRMCNCSIGALGDSVEGLQRAIDYLKSWEKGVI